MCCLVSPVPVTTVWFFRHCGVNEKPGSVPIAEKTTALPRGGKAIGTFRHALRQAHWRGPLLRRVERWVIDFIPPLVECGCNDDRGKKMDELILGKLFEKAATHAAGVTPEVRDVFETLVAVTLRERDRLKQDRGMVLCVRDVRAALDLLIETMRGSPVPDEADSVHRNLVQAWIRELGPLSDG